MLFFHPDIHYEIRESYLWYETKAIGLGKAFVEELELAFRRIEELPDTWPLISNPFRRYLLNRFPYGVIYSIKNEGVFILAVMHLSRKPGYWRQRI